MAFAQKSNGDFDPTWDFTKQEILIGKYIDKKTDVGSMSGNVYTLENKDGSKRLGIWGKTAIKTFFDSTAFGSVVRIEYKGMATPKNGGKPYYNFDFAIGEESDLTMDMKEAKGEDVNGEMPF